MNIKHTLIYLSIVISFLVVVYNYFNYLGYIRLIKLYNMEPVKLYNNNVPKYNNHKIKIVITPDCESKDIVTRFCPIVNSMLLQNIQLHSIDIILPNECSYKVEDSIKDYVKIRYLHADYDKNMRGIIHSLLQEIDNETIFIHIDQNILYGHDFIHNIISNLNKNTNCVYYHYDDIYKCVVYKPDFFNYSMDYTKMTASNFKLYLAKNISLKKINNYEHNFKIIKKI